MINVSASPPPTDSTASPAALAAPRVCPACAAPPLQSFTLHNGAPLLCCPRCRLAWWPWPAFDPAAFYDQDYFQSAQAQKGYNDYASLEPGVRRTARSRLTRLRKLLGAPGRLFEIGCGTGLFLDEARAAGWEARGLEVSAYAADVARRRGFDVAGVPAEEANLPAGGFDAVVMWDVIEHVRDPAGLLETAGRAVRPGGLLALSTGDITSLCARWSGAKWHLFNLPEHLFFFSPDSLRRLFARAGCPVVERRYEVNWVPMSYVVERLRKMFRRDVAVSAAPARNGWVIPATLFDVLGVYGRRAGATHSDSEFRR